MRRGGGGNEKEGGGDSDVSLVGVVVFVLLNNGRVWLCLCSSTMVGLRNDLGLNFRISRTIREGQ
jgi:hypothetical protein